MKKETKKAVKSCLKNSTSLTETAVLDIARSRLGRFLPLEADGYACITGQLLDVLLAVSANKETIEQVCADLNIKVGAETIRGYFNQQLQVENLVELQKSVNLALQVSLGCELKRRKLEVAMDLHDQPFYGKSEQSEGLWVGAEASKRNDAGLSGGNGLCHQKRVSVDAWNKGVCCRRKRRKKSLNIC